MRGSKKHIDLLACAKRLRVFAPGDVVLAAVSGGADSVAMLHSLIAYSKEIGFTLQVCHINHMIRQTACNDEAFVVDLCSQFDIPCVVRKVDVPGMVVDGGGIEEAARNARYAALEQVADEIGARWIAVAHTADDVAETLLLNIIRGTGIDGLGSIKPIRGRIIRPVLDATRTEVEEYMEQNGISFVVDETNTDISYSRNRIRHELIPYLQTHFNPSVKQALKRLSITAGDAYSLISDQSNEARKSLGAGEDLSVSVFQGLPKAVKYQVIREEITRAKGDPLDIEFEQIQRIVDALDADMGFHITLPGGVMEVVRKHESFCFRTVHAPEQEKWSIELPVPGTITIPNSTQTISSRIIERPKSLKVPLSTALLDPNRIKGQLIIRCPQPGDRIVPFGMKGSKKLQDIFVDAHIPARKRPNWPIITDTEKILWLPNLVTSDQSAVLQTTQTIIELTTCHPEE